jgi:hypothetical protein
MKATQSIRGVPIPSCDTGNSVVRSPEDNVERLESYRIILPGKDVMEKVH